MITQVTDKALFGIKNLAFRSYARMYCDIERDFTRSAVSYGLGFVRESADVTCGQLAEHVVDKLAAGARSLKTTARAST